MSCVLWLLAAGHAHGAVHTYEIAGKHLIQADFPDYFPQLYVFNSQGDLFYMSGEARGNALGDLRTLMHDLDANKLPHSLQWLQYGRNASGAVRRIYPFSASRRTAHALPR